MNDLNGIPHEIFFELYDFLLNGQEMSSHSRPQKSLNSTTILGIFKIINSGKCELPEDQLLINKTSMVLSTLT